MTRAENYVTLEFLSRSSNESFARTAAAGFAAQLDPTLDELGDIKTAVSEAVTNAIVHAYPDELGRSVLKLKLLPGANAVRDMLDKTFGNGGWRMRRYSADGRLWCQVGVYIPSTREYCDKESGALNLPCRDVAQMKEDTSFVSAASFWGVGRDVMELDDIVLKSTQVPIVKDDKGVCRLQTSLKVDRFAYDDAGSITMVQFVTGEGKKILWPEA